MAKELEEAKANFTREAEDHDRLCLAVELLREPLEVLPPRSVDERVQAVQGMPRRIHALGVASLRYGIRQTLAIARPHYEDINLEAVSHGFPTVYSDEALDAFEQEAAPFAATQAECIKDDDEFPCKPTQ